MNRLIISKLVMFIAFLLSIYGVTKADDTQDYEKQLKIVNSKLKLSPNNIDLIWEQAGLNYVIAETTGRMSYLVKAENSFRQLQELMPSNQRVALAMYQTYGLKVSLGDIAQLEIIRQIFDELDNESKPQIAPPSWVEYWARSYYPARFKDIPSNSEIVLKQNLSLMINAIKEQPEFIDSYLVLGEIYSEQGSYASALAVTKQALNKSPDNAQVLSATGDRYLEKIWEDNCPYNNYEDLDSAKKYVLQALRLTPQDDYIHASLAEIYEYQGNIKLAMNESRTAARMHDDSFNLYHLANMLIMYGDKKEALEVIGKLREIDKADMNKALFNLNILSGEFAAANKLLDPEPADGVYSYFQKGIIGEQIGSKYGLKYFASRAYKIEELEGWELALTRFNAEISDYEELQSMAVDVCKITEANFYHGYKMMISGKVGEAKQQFSKNIDLPTTSYFDYQMSKYFLSTLMNDG